jgi:hypothetical protein
VLCGYNKIGLAHTGNILDTEGRPNIAVGAAADVVTCVIVRGVVVDDGIRVEVEVQPADFVCIMT